MTSKILFLALLISAASCQQDEDDGSYNAEKYEKPYENLIDENSESGQQQQFANPIPAAFQQPQQLQQVQPQQPSFFQQPQQLQQVQPQQPSFFQQPANVPAQQPTFASENPFPQNPFFRQLSNPQLQRQQQVPTFQQQNIVPQAPSFQPQNTLQFQQRTPFQLSQSPSVPSFRQPAPVNPILDDGLPLQSTNYQTNDGHQRSEVVDNDGNVQGQYSYVDPNGKTITVKYSAGKDGFQVEGDHIPKANQPLADQPQPQQASLFTQPQPSVPQNNIQFRPQQPRFDNQFPQQFFNPVQARSRFNSFQPQLQADSQQQFNQQPSQFSPQTPFSFQPDGGYELQSSFQN